jgi:hypothetical protein
LPSDGYDWTRTQSCAVEGDEDALVVGVGVGVEVVDEPAVGVSVGLDDWPELSVDDPVLVEVAGVADGETVEAGPPAVGVVVGLTTEESLTDMTLAVWSARPATLAPRQELSTVAVAGGSPQPEPESTTAACAAKVQTSSTETPKNASPIAAPSAAGLRSSALTVHPRFN